MKKCLALLLAVALTAGLLAGCGGKSSGSGSKTGDEKTAAEQGSAAENPFKDPVTLKIIMPGDESKRMNEFLKNEFGEKIKQEINTELEVTWAPWDQYWSKKDMMVAANEQLDMFWDGSGNFSNMVKNGAVTPLDELLDKYGSDIKRLMPEEHFKPFVIDGKLLALPMTYAPGSEYFRSVMVRKDLLDEVGVAEIKTTAELEQAYIKVKQKHPDIKFAASHMEAAFTRELLPFNSTYQLGDLHMIINEDTKKIDSLYLLPEFKQLVRQSTEFTKKGYFNDDMFIKGGESLSRFATGKYFAELGAISRPMEEINNIRKNVPAASLIEFKLGSNKESWISQSSGQILSIPPCSKNPGRAIAFVNWIYKSKENYMFSIYGVEGKDYTIQNDRIKLINTDTLWYEWMFRQKEYMQFPESISDQFIETFKNWDNNAKLSCAYGIVFDTAKVEEELARSGVILNEKLIPLACGFTTATDAEIEKIQDEYRKAGAEAVVKELQHQLDEFIANNK